MNNILQFKIKTETPKSHLEACSVIDYFRSGIISHKFGTHEDDFYGEFFLEGSGECFEIMSSISGITVFMDPTNTIR